MRQIAFILGAVCLAAIVLPSCVEQPEPAAEEVVSTEADESAIKSVIGEMVAAANASDANRFLGTFSNDIIIMPPDQPDVIGKDMVRPYYQAIFNGYDISGVDIRVDEIVVCGDWAFVRAEWVGIMTPKQEGDVIDFQNGAVWIFRRQADGLWKAARGIWNSNTLPST